VIDVLLVEDNPGDVLITREAFAENPGKTGSNTLHVVSDGVSAMNFLRKRGKYADAPTPDLILLDLNLPGMDGREVLAAVKNDRVLRQIPVVVLTTSKAEEDVLRSYNLSAASYITKPVTFDGLLEVVKALGKYWLEIVELPSDDGTTP
jgi:CheY-like chemotaxis protein